MQSFPNETWIEAISATLASYREMIDTTIVQLSDAELHARPAPEINSVAILLRHIGGNLRSRWTDFLTTDGEKPDRARDTEFQDWEGDRAALLAHLDLGWSALTSAIEQVKHTNMDQPMFIRGHHHTIHEALTRSVTHVTYHVGQIVMIARMVHEGPWQWVTISPGQSDQYNQDNWGTGSSRSILHDPNANKDGPS